MHRRSSFAGVVAGATLAGCSLAADVAPPPRPPDAPVCAATGGSCTVGVFSGRCGPDTGEARFACEAASGRCAWFTSACIPDGFVASACPATDLCCLDGYPFDASWREPVAPDATVQAFLLAWGTTPWDDARALDVAVRVDPGLDAAPTALHCEGPSCELTPSRSVLRLETTTFVVLFLGNGGLGYVQLLVEVIGDRARVCQRYSQDGVVYRCESGAPPRYPCASSGSLTLSARPGSVPDPELLGALDVGFPDGTRVRGRFRDLSRSP